MRKHFVILPFLVSNNKTLPDGPRVIELDVDHSFYILEGSEGPFATIQELKSSSEIYKNLKLSNPKRAQRILEDRYIVKPVSSILYPDDNSEYLKHIYNIIQHASNGKVDRNGVLGIHLFNPKKIKILEITKTINKQGIWEALIEVHSQNSGKWIKKEYPTTFFPENWDLQRLVLECRVAFDERIKLSTRKFVGKTQSGIPVTMIFNNGILKTIYPNYE